MRLGCEAIYLDVTQLSVNLSHYVERGFTKQAFPLHRAAEGPGVGLI